MGWRFRKSFKIAPGVKLNLNKNSHSFTFGGKGAHYTINSKGKRTKTVGIPGTGISYTESTSKKSNNAGGKKTNMSGKDSGGQSIGCLGFIGILILFCIALYLYSFCWIPAIPILIYFIVSKKYAIHKKRNITICSIVLATSLIAFAMLNSPSDLNSITADWGKTTFDISETIEVKITGSPDDAEISSLELSKNNIAKLEYLDGKAFITFTDTGEAALFFTANDDVTSSTTTITVVDREAEEQAQKEAEERAAQERLAKEQAEQEAQAQAEQEAAEQAEQEKAQQEEQSSQEQQQPQEQMVWIPQSGSKYHSTSSCSGMKNPTQVTISEAQSMGYAPCKKCY